MNRYDVDATVISRPTDRVRWAAIFAGLFAAITTLVVLGILGLAIGLSSYNAGEPLQNFGIGAGIWGAFSAIIAFAVGGWLAARTAALAGRGIGALNGAMVWIVAIPLMLYVLGSGIGTLVGAASNVAANPSVTNSVTNAAEQNNQNTGANTQNNNTGQANPGTNVTPAQAENTANNAGGALWGTLLWIVVGFVAATVGGMVGARPSLEDLANDATRRTTSSTTNTGTGYTGQS